MTDPREDDAFVDELKRLGRYDLLKNKVGTVDEAPLHYGGGTRAIPPVEYIKSHDMDFLQGNVIKYVTRYKRKGQPLEDLSKARVYLDLMLKELEEY